MTDRNVQTNFEMPLMVERAEANSENQTIPVSFASDRIIDDPFLGPIRLSMDPSAVDLQRAEDRGIPVRLMHARGLPLARVEDVRIDGDKLRGEMRFSQSDAGQALYRDASDGIITDLSVGAAIFAIREEDDHTLAIRWQPREVSLVDEGADPSVGVNRSAAQATQTAATAEAPAASHPETIMTDQPQEPAATDLVPETPEVVSRHAEHIMRLADYLEKSYPNLGLKRLGEDYAAFDKTLDEFKGEAWKILGEHQRQQPTPSVPTEIGITQQEAQNFSIIRACNAYLTNNWKKAGFELEASRAVAENLGREARGFFVPLEVQRQMATTPDAQGGFLVAEEHRADQFIEALRARSIAFLAGARSLTGLVGNVAIPKQAAGATFYWLDEDEDGTDSLLTMAQVALTPHTVAGAVPMTRRILLQSSPDIEQLVRNDLVIGSALAIDRAVYEGDGVKEPAGVSGHPDVNAVTLATPGAPTWPEAVSFESAVEASDALDGSLRFCTTAAVRGSTKTTAVDAGSGMFVCTPENTINGYPLLVSSQLVQHRILFGDFSQVLVGFWGVLDLKPDEATKAASGGLVLRSFQDCDVGVRHGESFASSNLV